MTSYNDTLHVENLLLPRHCLLFASAEGRLMSRLYAAAAALATSRRPTLLAMRTQLDAQDLMCFHHHTKEAQKNAQQQYNHDSNAKLT